MRRPDIRVRPLPNAAPAANCLQRPLVPRSRFRQRLRRSVRWPVRKDFREEEKRIRYWNDAECHQILATISRAAPPRGRVWIFERIVPDPNTPPFAKLFDVLMIIVSTGRERTLEEYTGLLAGAGWTYRQTWYPASKMLGGVEGVQA